MAEEKESKEKKAKVADPMQATIDPASQQMIARAQELGIDTCFDRAENLKPCNIGAQGICCKNCAMGPCRLPLPKGGIQGEDTRKGICGATANTIAARNFIRMIAGGAAAHSDHGRGVAEVFLSAARKENKDYKIKDPIKLKIVAEALGVDTTVDVDGQIKDRDIEEIAEVSDCSRPVSGLQARLGLHDHLYGTPGVQKLCTRGLQRGVVQAESAKQSLGDAGDP